MTIHPIRNEADHAAALTRMEALRSAAAGSEEAAELDALATLVDDYEAKRFPLAAARPHEVLRYAIDEMGHSEEELAVFLGSKARARRALAGELSLSVDVTRNISAGWRIPADLLIGPAPEETAARSAAR